MNQEEKITSLYFNNLGHKNLVPFPLGKNEPPDFSLNKIGIEVRRLNDDYLYKKNRNNNLDIILYNFTKNMVNEIRDKVIHKSLILTAKYRYSIRKEKLKKGKGEIYKKSLNSLLSIINSYDVFENELEISDEIRLKISIQKSNEPRIICGYPRNIDGAKFMMPTLIHSIEHIIKEKNRKIEHLESDFKENWLVLVDHLNLHFLEKDEEMYIENYNFNKMIFNKIIILT